MSLSATDEVNGHAQQISNSEHDSQPITERLDFTLGWLCLVRYHERQCVEMHQQLECRARGEIISCTSRRSPVVLLLFPGIFELKESGTVLGGRGYSLFDLECLQDCRFDDCRFGFNVDLLRFDELFDNEFVSCVVVDRNGGLRI